MNCFEISTGVCTASAVLFFFQAHNHFWLVIAALMGMSFGSFLNVVIHRLPLMLDKTRPSTGMNLCFPRSYCPYCGHNIANRDNIPVVGYLRLRGRCRHCQTPISARYPLVELLSGVLCVLSAWLLGPTWECLLSWLLIWLCIASSFILWDKRAAHDDLS
jgi:leader peptidase (prepilin peptidase)/N-methyltransferase